MSDNDAGAFWETRYAGEQAIWSGNPNIALVAEAGRLQPGRALDLGCGEGADSVWLAEQGWQVTAIDISPTAIERGKAAAERQGVPEGRIRWLVEDLGAWWPSDTYELVSACFFHSPVEFPRSAILQRAATAVRPDGRLLIVAHAEFPPWAAAHHHRDRLLTPEDEIAALELDEHWDVEVSEIRPREATGPDGAPAVLRDSVVLLHRR